MPAEYLACVSSEEKDGKSHEEAQRICAISFYKKHGKIPQQAENDSNPQASMFKQEDRMKLAESDIYIVNQNERIFKGWATLPVMSSKGQIIPIELSKQDAVTQLLRQTSLLVEHTHMVVGKLINVEFGIHPIYGVEGQLCTYQVFKNYPADSIAWRRINGERVITPDGVLEPFVGISTGGENGIPDAKGVVPWIAFCEHSLTTNPAVRGATLVVMSAANSTTGTGVAGTASKELNIPPTVSGNMAENSDEKKPTLPQNEGNPKAAAALKSTPASFSEKAEEKKNSEPDKTTPANPPAPITPATSSANGTPEHEQKEQSTLAEIKADTTAIKMLIQGGQAAQASLSTHGNPASSLPTSSTKPDEKKDEKPEGKKEENSMSADEDAKKKAEEAKNAGETKPATPEAPKYKSAHISEMEKGYELTHSDPEIKEHHETLESAYSSLSKHFGKSTEAKNTAGVEAKNSEPEKKVAPPVMDAKNMSLTPATATPRPAGSSPADPSVSMPVIPGAGENQDSGSTLSDVKAVLGGQKQFDTTGYVKKMSANAGRGG